MAGKPICARAAGLTGPMDVTTTDILKNAVASHPWSLPSMKVYISATQKDLLEYRAAVHAVARRLEIEDVAMEAYGADVRPPLERCLTDVRRCDLYVGLFAWRYGYRPPGQESSITELEYREALAAGKPCLIFLLAEDMPWPPDMIDRNRQQIVALRNELKERHCAPSSPAWTTCRRRSPWRLPTCAAAGHRRVSPATPTPTCRRRSAASTTNSFGCGTRRCRWTPCHPDPRSAT